MLKLLSVTFEETDVAGTFSAAKPVFVQTTADSLKQRRSNL